MTSLETVDLVMLDETSRSLFLMATTLYHCIITAALLGLIVIATTTETTPQLLSINSSRHRGGGEIGRATAPPLFCLGLGLQDKYDSVQMHDKWRNDDP